MPRKIRRARRRGFVCRLPQRKQPPRPADHLWSLNLVVMVLSLLVALFAFGWYLVPQMIDPPIEVMTVERPPIPDAENIHAGLLEAEAAYDLDARLAVLEAFEVDLPIDAVVTADVDACADYYAALEQVLARPRFEWRVGELGGAGEAECKRVYRAPWRAAEMLLERAEVRSARGQGVAAAGDLRAAWRLAIQSHQAATALAPWLHGTSNEVKVLKSIRRALGEAPEVVPPLPTHACPVRRWAPAEREVWEALLADLLAAPPPGPVLARALEDEYCRVPEELEQQRVVFEDFGIDGFIETISLIYLPGQAVREGRATISEFIPAARLPRWDRPEFGPEIWGEEYRGLFTFNHFGREAMSSLRPSSIRHLNRLDHSQALLRLTILQIALKLYLDDEGRLPFKLDRLVERGYLESVPLDPFDGQPLRYKPDEVLVYAVGIDEMDNGGIEPGREDRDYEDVLAPLIFVVGEPPANAERAAPAVR